MPWTNCRFLILPFLLAGLAGPDLLAEDSAGPSIITKSPFLPPDFNPPGAAGADSAMPASASQYEFRGVYQMGGVYYFHLYNTRDKKGSWITEKDSGGDLPQIISYDLQEDRLVVNVAGEQVNLSMIDTSDRPIPLTNTRPAAKTASPATTASAASRTATPVRRRVIRPTTRTTPSTATRRPTIPASNQQQQNP